jgi:hypothetical protein
MTPALNDLAELAQLRDAFNGDHGFVRLIVLHSPT